MYAYAVFRDQRECRVGSRRLSKGNFVSQLDNEVSEVYPGCDCFQAIFSNKSSERARFMALALHPRMKGLAFDGRGAYPTMACTKRNGRLRQAGGPFGNHLPLQIRTRAAARTGSGARGAPSAFRKNAADLGSSSYMRLVLACPANMQTFRFGY